MIPDNFAIRQVDRASDRILRNLLECYCHDMAEWFLFDANEDGLYAYDTAALWDHGVDVHLAFVGRIPIGFALIGSAAAYVEDAGVRDLDEFFVVRRHRRCGIGRALATYCWDMYPGKWLVRVYDGNAPGLAFWRRAIAEYSDEAFTVEAREIRGRTWSYFTFEAPGASAEARLR
jgi:predicted acetyltransferase